MRIKIFKFKHHDWTHFLFWISRSIHYFNVCPPITSHAFYTGCWSKARYSSSQRNHVCSHMSQSFSEPWFYHSSGRGLTYLYVQTTCLDLFVLFYRFWSDVRVCLSYHQLSPSKKRKDNEYTYLQAPQIHCPIRTWENSGMMWWCATWIMTM